MNTNSKNKIIKAGSFYTICNVLLKGISFFSVPLFVRLLTPDEFGRFNVFISIEGFIFVFSALAIHSSIKNALYDKEESFDSYVKNCVYFDFFNSIILALIANLICFFYSKEIDLSFLEVNLLVVSGFCQALITIYTSRLIMEYKSGDFVIISLLSVILGITLSLLLIFTLFDSNHYLGRILGVVFAQLLVVVYVIAKIFRDGFSKINIQDWKYGLKISLPIVPHGISQVILSMSARVIIKYVYNAALAGIFSFTYLMSLIPQILFTSIANVWEPWFFEQMNGNRYESIKSGSLFFCKLISVVFVLMSCVIPDIIYIFSTPEYFDAVDISIIVLISSYFATLYNIPCEVEYFYKKTKYIAFSTIICAIVYITLNLFLMQYFSYKIAAYTMAFSYFLYFLFHMIMARIVGKRMFFDIRKMSFIIMVSCFLMILILYTENFLAIRLIVFTFSSIYLFVILQKFGLFNLLIKKIKK